MRSNIIAIACAIAAAIAGYVAAADDPLCFAIGEVMKLAGKCGGVQ